MQPSSTLAGLRFVQPSGLLPSKSRIQPSFLSCSLSSLSPANSRVSAIIIRVMEILLYSYAREGSGGDPDQRSVSGGSVLSTPSRSSTQTSPVLPPAKESAVTCTPNDLTKPCHFPSFAPPQC